jgi:hypothetical protein
MTNILSSEENKCPVRNEQQGSMRTVLFFSHEKDGRYCSQHVDRYCVTIQLPVTMNVSDSGERNKYAK